MLTSEEVEGEPADAADRVELCEHESKRNNSIGWRRSESQPPTAATG
jgi:hypothetical protein